MPVPICILGLSKSCKLIRLPLTLAGLPSAVVLSCASILSKNSVLTCVSAISASPREVPAFTVHVDLLLRCAPVDSLLRCAPVASLLRCAPAQLALRANLRLLHLAPAPALDCLSPRSVRYRAGVLRCATVASFAPAHLALRAACGRLPSQRPLACVRSRSVDSQALPTCSPFGVAFGNLSPFGRLWLISLYSGLLLHVCSLTVVSHKA